MFATPSAPTPGDASPGADLVVVCTANRCRSPMAQFLFTARAADAGRRWRVESAGTHARAGEPVAPEVLTALGELGVPNGPHAARPLVPAEVARAEMVLTAERAHRSLVLQESPGLVGRVFTLLEFERLLHEARRRHPDRRARDLGELGRWAESARAAAGRGGPADDLADPIGRPLAQYRDCAATLDRIARATVAALAGQP